VVVRANQFQDIELLYQLGGKEVVQPEFEASLEMASHLLYKLGLPLAKVQQEVSQIRNSHYLELRPDSGIKTDKIDVEAATVGMSTKWFNIPVISPLSGMSIEEANIRSLTGITILSIRRENGEELPYPSEDTLLLDGDRCLVVGSADEKVAFKQLVRGKIALPISNSACQWLVIPPASMAVGLTLSTLDTYRQYGVQIRALRRAQQFIDNPEQQSTIIMGGDRLLLCGGHYPLKKLQQQLTTEHADFIVATDLDVG
jgi:CPA2 family monovalent cation:H+ antiporter-2